MLHAQQYREAFAAWERAASRYCDSVVRDPRNLQLGATLLGAGLAWERASKELSWWWCR